MNVSTLFNFIWSTIKGFLEEHTKKKIYITKNNTCSELQELFEPSQLEERYGGTAQNMDAPWWPPRFPQTSVGPDPAKLISEEEYEEYLADRPSLKMCPAFTAKKAEEEKKAIDFASENEADGSSHMSEESVDIDELDVTNIESATLNFSKKYHFIQHK